MCSQEEIVTLVKLAQKQEEHDSSAAAASYLQAAQLLLRQSETSPHKEEEYIAVANKLYLKAKKLQSPVSPKIIANSENTLTFADIGGLEELKEEIRFKIIEPLRNPDLFGYYGKKAGGGILMYGPPGCGKTLIAKATAHEAQVNFIHVKGSDIKSKFVGETEQNIAQLFQKARDCQPAIIFFDELEALGGDRSDAASYERSAVAQLLTEMDGVDAKGQQLLLLAATNEPWSIDPALRREGRLGSTIFIPPPDDQSRKAIFQIEMASKPVHDLDYEELAALTEKLSGADIKAVCEMAIDIPLKESMKTQERRAITMDDMKQGMVKINSVLPQWFAKAREQIGKRKLEDGFPELVGKMPMAVLTN